ncbi:MAG TPA: YicC/YloC family endoribonuclease, partial [Gemmatimonas sp.]|nr:YicC/YloC family endoribonuclease [Gemmatimonas sp.]
MIRSMTGFGQAEGTVGTSRVSVEVRTVNHRFFSPSIKLPNQFARWETEVREAMRTRVSRGHVTLSARVERAESGAATIDEQRFAAVVAQFRSLQERHGLDGGVDIGAVLRMPDVIAIPREDDAESGTVAELVTIAERALDALSRMRD